MELIDNSEESKSLLQCFQKQFYNIENENDIHNIKEICILTAYCYYKVFRHIIKNENTKNIFLKAKVKILIGLNIDVETRRLYFNNENEKENDKNKTINDLKEYTLSEYENEEYSQIIKLFKEKCENGSLEIRKTAEDMHAKLYLFKYNKEAQKDAFLIGSSNFTHSGIKERKELNIYHKEGFDELYNYFKKEWESSSPILNINNEKEFFKGIKIVDLIYPYQIFLKVIYEYFDSANKEKLLCSPADYGYRNYKYQIDAIKNGIKGIMNFDGVLISDVVGLGKSIVASTIAKNMLLKEKINEIIIICPPKIIDSWENYNNEFQINARIFSIGLLDDALEYIKNHKAKRLIIIDEAHRFVNSRTYSYSRITEICFGNKVMLLTATPMHNTTSDIFSIIDLFDKKLTKNKNIEDKKIKILKEEKEIKSKFKKSELSKEENINKTKKLAKDIISLISPIIIRRTRKDLFEDTEYKKDLIKQKTEFNDVEDPKLHDYELGDLSKLYADTLEKISPYNEENDTKNNFKNNLENIFMGVRYKPLIYLKKETNEERRKSEKIVKEVYGENSNFDFADISSNNIAKFMRHLLVRRFESSIYAFKKSIENMIGKYENIKRFISNNNIYPIYKRGDIDYEDFFDNDIEDYDKKYEGLTIIENVKEVLSEDFFNSFENDLKILKEIQKDWKNIGVDKDKKFFKLKEELKKFKKENEKRKIIIFSEFKDTVDYLYKSVCEDEQLNDLFKPLKSVADSKNRETVKANFDASIDERKQENEHFLLISTDTLSEGVNLHRAGIIINYDIPYNPTRVIQRVGRINRIDKKLFDKIYIHNFIPRLEAQKDIKNWQISNFKLTLINAIFGNDTKILQKDDEINSLFSLKKEADILEDEEKSWDIEYRNIYNKLKDNGELLEKIKNLKDNIFIRRERDFEGLLEIRRCEDGILAMLLKDSDMDYNIANIFKILKAEENEKPFSKSDKAERLIEQFERMQNIKKTYNKQDILIKLKKYKDMEFKISLSDREYIEKIIKAIEYNQLSKIQIKDIEKVFKNNRDIEILKGIKNIVDKNSLNSINYIEMDSWENSQLIVREEFSKLKDM